MGREWLAGVADIDGDADAGEAAVAAADDGGAAAVDAGGEGVLRALQIEGPREGGVSTEESQ